MIADELKSMMCESKGHIIVGYSGGMDSHVLLHYLKNRLDASLYALHINHGLSKDAEIWQAHCERVCLQMGVMLSTIKVEVTKSGSLEAAARDARYVAFEHHLQQDDLLILAHHQDDQTETVFLRLLRGDSPFGLSGMPRQRALGRGSILRPMLNTSRTAIQSYAELHGLKWIEDESNLDTSMDRNYLRHKVLPLLKARWPGLQKRLDRSLGRSGEIMEVIDSIAVNDLDQAMLQPHKVDLMRLKELPRLRQRNLLRAWFRHHGIVRIPPVGLLNTGLDGFINGKDDSAPLLNWQAVQVRRFDGFLYLLPNMRKTSPQKPYTFSGEPVQMTNGVVEAEATRGHGLVMDSFEQLSIRFRQGGEKIRFRQNRSLKNVFQENNIPAFLRDFIPLIYFDEQLVAFAAVPDWNLPFIVCPGAEAGSSDSGWQFNWRF